VNASEKLTLLKAQLEPQLRAQLKGMGGAAAMASAFVVPQVEGYVDRHLVRPADELDAELAKAIDFLCRLRSDDAGPLVAGAGGAFELQITDRQPSTEGLLELRGVVVAPVRAQGVLDGGDEDGQEHVGAGTLPLGGGAQAGDRPGG